MAISEEVQLKVMADASAAMREMAKLTESMAGARKKAEDAGGGFDKFLSGARDKFIVLEGVIRNVNRAMDLLSGAMDSAMNRLKEQQMQQAAVKKFGEEWVSSMTASTRRWIDDDDLMKKALQSTRGELALNKAQFELVAKAAGTLADKEGRDYQEVLDGLIDGMKGKTKGLKEYGIAVKNTGTDQEKFNDLIRQYKNLANEPTQVDPELAALQEKQAKLRDFMDSMMDALTTAVVKFMGFMDTIKGAVTAIAGVISDAAYRLGLGGGTNIKDRMGQTTAMKYMLNPNQSMDDARMYFKMTGENELRLPNGETISYNREKGVVMRIGTPGSVPTAADALGHRPGDGGGDDKGKGGYILNAAQRNLASDDLMAVFDEFMRKSFGGWGGQRQDYGLGQYVGENEYAKGPDEGGFRLNAAQRDLDSEQSDQSKALEAQRRKSDRVLAKLQDETSPLGAAFSTLSDGITAAVDAAITGEASIGKAIAAATAAALKGIAIQATTKALWETAEGVAALAIGGPVAGVSASAHFKAAALYAGVAAAAGIGAGAMYRAGAGEGGGAGSSASTPAGGGYIGQRGSSDGGSVTVIIQGDVYDVDRLAEKVTKAVRKRDRRLGSDDGAVIRE